MFIPRLISSICFLILITGIVRFELSTPTYLLISVIALLALWEFYLLQESKGVRIFKKAGVFCASLFFLAEYFYLVKPGVFGQSESLESLIISLVIIVILGRMIFEKERKTPMLTIALTLFGFFYVPYLFHFLSKIIFPDDDGAMSGVYLAAYLIAVTKMTDIGAYLIGSRYGKHKMSPQISPEKSWEGLAAGLVSGLLVSLLMVQLMPVALGELDIAHAIILGLLIPSIGVMGDLAESIVKRDADIKDSGGVIPGIGGSFDLIDSLLYTAPLFYFYLVWIVR
ncbi:MAG: phosphatidate cytidylyltransferase [Verrucomicrobiota bacterium]